MKKFKDLSLKGQKMRIVKDAISQIKIGKIIPSLGTYFMLNDIPDFKNLQKELVKTKNTCEACAKGALFAACVINVNRVSIEDTVGENKFQVRKLKKWFTKDEIDLMETAFETEVIADENPTLHAKQGEDDDDSWDNTDLANTAIVFGLKYSNPQERLLAILENILQNGTFKP